MANILLIEDNQSNAELIKRVLTTAGHEVKHFVRGLDGARAARKENPDLILLDFNLPDVDGRNMILTLKRQLGEIPIVAVSARASQLEQQLSRRLGCDAFVAKPFEPELLVEVVTQIIQHSPTSDLTAPTDN